MNKKVLSVQIDFYDDKIGDSNVHTFYRSFSELEDATLFFGIDLITCEYYDPDSHGFVCRCFSVKSVLHMDVHYYD